MNTRHLLLGLLLLLLCCQQCNTIAAAAKAKEAADTFLSILDSVIKVGEFLLKAIKVFDELADKHRAKVLVRVQNMMKQPITQCTVITNKGITRSSPPITIASGYKEGFAAQQNNPGQGIDMIFSCRVKSPSGQAFRGSVHFKIKQQVAGRRPNRLSVDIAEDEDNDLIDNECYKSLISDSESFDKAIQCATPHFAVQTTMSTSHQSEVDIFIYPKAIVNFADSVNQKLNKTGNAQNELDAVLDFPQSCVPDDDKASCNSGNTPAATVGILGIIIAAFIV